MAGYSVADKNKSKREVNGEISLRGALRIRIGKPLGTGSVAGGSLDHSSRQAVWRSVPAADDHAGGASTRKAGRKGRSNRKNRVAAVFGRFRHERGASFGQPGHRFRRRGTDADHLVAHA